MTDIIDVPCTLTPASVAAMLEDLRAADEPGSAQALLLMGGVDVFCRGMDLSILSNGAGQGKLEATLEAFVHVLMTLCRMSRPTIAVVEGSATGGGVGLAAACDYVIASPMAGFALPEVVLGLVPGMIYPVVRGRVSAARLKMMAIDGNVRSADEALEMGLVDEVVEKHRLESRVKRQSRVMSRGFPPAIVAIKALGDGDEANGLETAIRHGMGKTMEMLRQPGTQARIKAWQDGDAPWLT